MVVESDLMPETWWLSMPNRACILDYETGEGIVSVAAEYVETLSGDGGAPHLHFRTLPASGEKVMPPTEVRLLSIVDGSSCVYRMRVVAFASEALVLDAEPLSVARRPLRRYPRTPYRLGPCTAVVHSAFHQWRGLVEFWVHDVSPEGIGFAIVSAHVNRVVVGDRLRAPVTLPDGQRSWIDGEVVWLTSDGRGGLMTRRAPRWETEATAAEAC